MLLISDSHKQPGAPLCSPSHVCALFKTSFFPFPCSLRWKDQSEDRSGDLSGDLSGDQSGDQSQDQSRDQSRDQSGDQDLANGTRYGSPRTHSRDATMGKTARLKPCAERR
uniref:Uncharacterized protein n=1 Tax=Knipowitschia caucasica TaxID=637954 RepID=A0AAV2KEL3_KNICA